MNTPQTLTRPLAARVAGLPEVVEPTYNPPIPEGVIEAAIQALKEGKTHYTDRPGILGLRKWVTEYLQKQFNVMLKPDEVTITCGATEARFVVIKRLVKAGGVILCSGDSKVIEGAAQLVGVNITRDTSNLAGILLLYATPKDSLERLQPLLEQAEVNGWWVAWDVSQKPPPQSSPASRGVIHETLSHQRDEKGASRNPHPNPPPQAMEGDMQNATAIFKGGSNTSFHPAQNAGIASKVISVGSFSDVMPGWRVGWMAGSEMADKLRAYKQSMTICSTSISQWAGMGLVE